MCIKRKSIQLSIVLKMPTAVVWLVLCLIQTAVSVVVNTPSGPVQGAPSPLQPDVSRFLGVRFANPPMRFAKPEMVTPWTEMYDATFYRPACYQTNFTPGIEMSEDCLFVDIYVPGDASRKNLSTNPKAVMVWIYGGAFVMGYSSQYEGSRLAATGDVIVVALNYRLGVFGWMYNGEKSPSNIGLWDQKLALEWVQANIHAFGGDKNKVTVFGESAGSISVSCLIMSPLINNTHFQRAILQSGSFLMGDPSEYIRDRVYDRMLEQTGCDDHLVVEVQLSCLREQPVEDLDSISKAALFLPTHDGVFLLESSLDIISEYGRQGTSDEVLAMVGNIQQYDTLIGFNGQEGFLLLAPVSAILGLSLEDGITNLSYEFCTRLMLATMHQGDQVNFLQANYAEDLPGRTHQEDNMHNLLTMLGDYVMAMPAVNTASLHADASTDKKTYMYMFDHIPAIGSFVICGPEWLQTSASHGDDIMYTIGMNLPPDFDPLTAEEKELRKALMTYWTNFAKTGDPKSEDFEERGGNKWQPFTTSDPNYMRLTLEEDICENDPRSGKQEVWQQIYNATTTSVGVHISEYLDATGLKLSSPLYQQITIPKTFSDQGSIFLRMLRKGLAALSQAITEMEGFGSQKKEVSDPQQVPEVKLASNELSKQVLMSSASSDCRGVAFTALIVMAVWLLMG